MREVSRLLPSPFLSQFTKAVAYVASLVGRSYNARSYFAKKLD